MGCCDELIFSKYSWRSKIKNVMTVKKSRSGFNLPKPVMLVVFLILCSIVNKCDAIEETVTSLKTNKEIKNDGGKLFTTEATVSSSSSSSAAKVTAGKNQQFTCPQSHFTCLSDGKCIPMHWKCDTHIDCEDGSDEPEECMISWHCVDGQFSCQHTYKCIPNGWLCDGDYDCGFNKKTNVLDKSDEEDRRCLNLTKCPPNQAACKPGQCIDIEKFCDGNWDCDNDELNCGNTTAQCHDMKCSYNCKITPEGPKCYCAEGQQPNGTFCEDLNECDIEGTCDQICENVPGSYKCSCVAGYTKIGNKCLAINVPKEEEPSLIFLTQKDIRRIAMNGDPWNFNSVFNLPNPVTIEMWHRNRSICLINAYVAGESEMKCLNIDDFSIQWTLPKPDLFSNLDTIEQISLDWISGNWYFMDRIQDIIFVCTNQMAHCSIILEKNLGHPRGMALDPTKGFIFFTKWGRTPAALGRALLDGSNVTKLITHKIVYPNEITLDLANQHVYWVDSYMDFIERVDYDGQNRWSVKKQSAQMIVQSLHGIIVFENMIYVTSWKNQSIIGLEKFKSDTKLIRTDTARPISLHVFHRQRQPEVSHPCRERNGDCEHLCIPYWKKNIAIAQCRCAPGYRLKTKTQCSLIKHSSFLIYAKEIPTMIKAISMTKNPSSISGSSMNGSSNSKQEAIVPITNLEWPISLDYNVKDQLIYFAHKEKGRDEYKIESQRFDGTDRKLIIGGLRSAISLAYDWMGHNLFWIDSTQNLIAVIKLTNTTVQRTLIRDRSIQPRSIVVDPRHGMMYWTTWAAQSRPVGSIESAWMDGTHRTVIVTAKERDIHWPTGLTIDYVEKKLYWCDTITSAIERVSFDGKDRELLYAESTKDIYPSSITYFNNYIFWTDSLKGHIRRLHLNGSIVEELDEPLIVEQAPLNDMKVFENMTQTGFNDCSDDKNCPGVCLITPQGPVCACGDGFALNAIGTKCMPQTNYTAPNDCQPGYFRCKNRRQCIEEKYLCDGDADCFDRSDESYEADGPCNANRKCDLETSYKCDKNICLNKSTLCDGIANCVDGFDENPINCPNVTCTDTQFHCKKSNRCIPMIWVCDHHLDCGPGDNSDEDDLCEKNMPICAEFTCIQTHKCIEYELLCDGVNNCGDNSDEHECLSDCRTDEFFCNPKGCLSKTKQCDGIVDCFDASDEENCQNVTIVSDNKKISHDIFCSPTEFKCSNGIECISKLMHCDGVADCLDKSDEINCTEQKSHKGSAYNETCDHPSRLCRSTNNCIKVEQLCDGRTDCPDGSDEGFRCIEKLCDSNAECSHYCHNAPEGVICSCPSHMFLQPDGYKCTMEHACEHWGTCSQICEQTGKKYNCKCYDGYVLQYDKFSCKSTNKDSPYVIFSNRQEIRGVDLKTLAVKNFYSALRNTIALDFLYTNESIQIFWTDVIDDKIYRGSLVDDSLSNVEAVVQSGLSTAEGLAVDWVGMNLYWVDSNLDQIEVARMNGNFRRTLVAGDMESPRAIALDPRDGLLFWTDWDESAPRVERCSMAGEYRKIIMHVHSIQGAWPNGLTLDYTQKRVYWIDARSDSIHTTNYEGGDHHLVIRDQETLSHPFGISLFENHVYWTDWRTNSVIRANKWNGSDVAVIQRTLTQPFGIQILHSSRQPSDGENPCSSDNGGCSHLCLLSINKSFKCECPHVMRLDTDNKTCIPNEQVLLFVTGPEIRGVDLLQPNHHTIPTISHATQVLSPTKIDFIVSESKLYWSDTDLNEIKTSGLSNGPIETILDTDILMPTGFAIDWISGIMYVSSGKQTSRILACNLNGEYITEIHSDLNSVSSIAVDPVNGQMYWSHGSSVGDNYKIEKSTMDGSNREVIVNNPKLADSLTIDYETKRLYYVIAWHGSIYYYDLVNQKVHEVLSPNMKNYPTSMSILFDTRNIPSVTVYKEHIYYAENLDSTIRKCSKDLCDDSEIIRNNTQSVFALKMYFPTAQTGTNSCAKNRGGCQHLCFSVSTESHVCKCAIGYEMNKTDPKKCIGYEQFILYSLGYELKGIPVYDNSQKYDSIDQPKVLLPISRISLASSIDYHTATDYLFWSDSERGTITKIKRDGTQREIILNQFEQLENNNGDWPSSLAIDWVAQNIYWSDEKRGIIEVARFNGSYRYVVAPNLNKPTALAVDPIAGLLFYAGERQIARIGLDGSSPFVVNNQSTFYNSIFLDIDNQVVYWSESQSGKIVRADYDGNQWSILLSENIVNPVAIAIIDKHLFIAESIHQKSNIKMVPLFNLTDITVIKSDSSSLRDMKIFSRSIQKGTNACAKDNGGCQELCLFNGTHPVCACSHGRISHKDSKTCEEYDNFLIYSRVTSIESIHVTDHNNLNGPIAKIQNSTLLKNSIALSYDYKRGGIFYSDIHWSSINWVLFNGSDHRILINKQISVEGLAFDPVSEQLFWTSNNGASIRSLLVSELSNDPTNNTERVKFVIKLRSSDKPRGIAVESCMAMVYWTNWNPLAASIQRAYISGYGLESIITTDIRMPNAITLDYENHKLYWADARLDKIERADYDGTHRVVLAHSTPKHPFAMAVYGDLLFWTDWVLHAVVRANKYSGSDVLWLRKDISRPMGIVVVQNTTQDCSADPCRILNGGCEDHCGVDKIGKVKCECTHGRLASDGRRCLNNGPSACRPDQFECSTVNCIPYQLTCDGTPHCPDGSDELLAFCNMRLCPKGFFQCNNHRCIPQNLTCDGIQNCGDGSDELNCNCTKDQFRCDSGQCILMKYRCDRDPDCPDLSDEMNCGTVVCPLSSFGNSDQVLHCENTTACYMKSWRCDGENDCWDGSDEADCPVTTTPTCGPDKFPCSNGVCISLDYRCDNEDDCLDGVNGGLSSDEQNCNKHCKDNQFTCLNDSVCIPSSWQCDGEVDCVDGSDELEHCANRTCPNSGFLCNSTGRCIPQAWVCDGEVDCRDGGEDEHPDLNCDTHLDKCSIFSFFCQSGECIDMHFVCDGDSDCADGSDELLGCVPGVFAHSSCGPDLFRCNNRKCIPKNFTCDFKSDCEDNSDEDPQMCVESTVICADPEWFRCENDVCISESKLCDGSDDCGDFSDEEACNVNECLEIDHLCAHKCEDKKVGYECKCNPGYKVSAKNRHSCEDVNECEERPCSQICINTFGSYHCQCAEGFERRGSDSCRAVSNVETKLIFSNRYYVREVDLAGHMELLVHNSSNAVALDYDWETQCYFWSDVTAIVSSIKKWCPSTNKTDILHQSLLQNPDGIAVDWVGRNLYWCDKGYHTIEVSTLDGKYRRVLLNKSVDLQEPRAIVLDPFNKFMFWSDWGDNPHIGKAGMDGSNPKKIVKDDLGWPNALTISFETNELFWGDAREDFIAVSDLNGENRQIIISRSTNPNMNLHHIFAIAVWEDRIYWTDWETKSVEHCHKYRGKNCSTLTTLIHRPMDIRVVHPYRQKKSKEDLCKTAGCSTLCLLSPDPPGYKCMCPDYFYLDKDNKSCVANCTAAQFHCIADYKCIPFYWKCDTQNDCTDGSDEPDHCPPFSCEPGQFQCTNKKCIHPSFICDGKDQCGDKSDETDCDDYTCFNAQFKCPKTANTTAFCIPQEKRCDEAIDCPNGEDEDNCSVKTCSSIQFQCANGKCIPKVWICDGDPDCTDASDEKDCRKRECPESEFKCNSGRCIPYSWRCDGEPDCQGGEDEPIECSENQPTCEHSYFRCNNSKCIPGRWHCDYENDCGDNSDEFGCKMRNCSESEFRCNDGRCIRGIFQCDGDYNCEDHSDEDDCNRTCTNEEFKCHDNAHCIKKTLLCDGDDDCSDGSDEKNCPCSADEFHCSNGRCIPNRWRCDGWNDCIDESDENADVCKKFQCQPSAFRCRNHKCVSKTVLCDGKDNCGDESDEQKYVCDQLQRCTPDKFQCTSDRVCIAKNLRCNGFPECTDSSDELNCKEPVCTFRTCSQVCLEKKGGNHTCKCLPGYTKGLAKNDTCRATGPEQYLLIASKSEFRFMRPQKADGSTVMGFILPPTAKISGFDILTTEKDMFIFWIDSNNSQIQKLNAAEFINAEKSMTMNKRESDADIIIINGLGRPVSLAVDWVTHRLYVIDAKINTIVSTDLNGNQLTSLVSTGHNPLDIVLDPESRIMIWSTYLSHGIMSAGMDGSMKKTIIEDSIEFPTSLTIDYPTRRLYWADHRKGTIESSLLDGTDRHIIKQFPDISKPRKIDVFEDYIYAALYNLSIIRLNKYGLEHGASLLKGHYPSAEILIEHPLKQDVNISNPCILHPCKPNVICLLSPALPFGRDCACPDEMVKSDGNPDMVRCQAITNIPELCDLKCGAGSCKITDGRPTCVCPLEFTGEFCQHYRCSGYCKNKGTCYIDPSRRQQMTPPLLKCHCPPSWTGERCDISVNACRKTCHNGATCAFSASDTNQCICADGYTGDHCQHCSDLKCSNGGICRKNISGKSACECPDAFTGKMCEIDACENYCSKNAECAINALTGPTCLCKPGFTGNLCETEICPQCQNGGSCIVTGEKARCSCPPRYSGQNCQIDLCTSSNPPNNGICSNRAASLCGVYYCQNGGICEEIDSVKVCNCPSEWDGPYCQKPAGISSQCNGYCENNGYCQLSARNVPTCSCVDGWEGEQCTKPPDCAEECGICQQYSSINECYCKDGSIQACTRNFEELSEEKVKVGSVITILAVVFGILVLLISFFGGAILLMRKRRIGQPFSHARLTENVEITNPMYLGDADDAIPVFVQEEQDKGHFANPVYESMYADAGISDGIQGHSGNISNAPDEKKGLLQHTQDDTNAQDLL